MQRLVGEIPDGDLAAVVHNLGGHDLAELIAAYRRCDLVADRPSIVFAYTIKGWGLPIAGDPLNHAALLNGAQIAEFRSALALNEQTEWDRFEPGSDAGRWCQRVGAMINNRPVGERAVVAVPPETSVVTAKPVSTQETFGRSIAALAGDAEVAKRLVTTSPDVSVSTNLGGWINKVGVFTPQDAEDFVGEGRLLRWRQGPTGRHIELGLSEMNLFLMLHALGLGHELHGEHLLPVGTVYDPFVCRGLDALIYALYNGARFVLVGTPSGVTLAPEGGAHQSSITASIGLELPGITCAEPAFARAVDWLLCDGLARLSAPDGESLYLRLSTRPIDQAPFEGLLAAVGAERLRREVLAGGYRLISPDHPADIVIAASGAVVPEALSAVDLLAGEGVTATLIDVTNQGRLYRGWTGSTRTAVAEARRASGDFHLATLIPPDDRSAALVTVHDAASHSMAWMGSVFGQRTVSVGVDSFGQSGSIDELYGLFGLTAEQIVNAALVALPHLTICSLTLLPDWRSREQTHGSQAAASWCTFLAAGAGRSGFGEGRDTREQNHQGCAVGNHHLRRRRSARAAGRRRCVGSRVAEHPDAQRARRRHGVGRRLVQRPRRGRYRQEQVEHAADVQHVRPRAGQAGQVLLQAPLDVRLRGPRKPRHVLV